MVNDQSVPLAGPCDQPRSKPRAKPTLVDTSEESAKEGSLTEFTQRSKASPPPTTFQLPSNKQASGPDQLGKPGPAEYYKTEDGRYGCLKCRSCYKHKRNLNKHKKYECGVQAQFQCADCLRKFKLKGSLKRHIVNKNCHNPRNKNCIGPAEYCKTEDGRYGCLKCQSSYKYKDTLSKHKKYECGVQAQFQCADCLRKFKLKRNLKRHIVNKVCHNRRNKNCLGPAEYYKTEDGRYGCLKCGSSYKYKDNLIRHKKYECGVQAQFQCADCLKKFKLKSHLNRHIVNKICHNRRNKNCLGPAEYCKTEDGRSLLTRHKNYKCGVQAQFQCADCLRKFKLKRQLKDHIINKSCHDRRNKNCLGLADYYKTEDGRYGCLKCGSSYKHKDHLIRHKKYECGVQAQFQCADCLRKFKLKSHLKRHIVNKICHNRRNKNCLGPAEYCKTEDGRSLLTRHKNCKCGVQAQFQCADCLRKFKLKRHLKYHIINKSCHNRRNKNCIGPAEYYKTEDGRYGCLKCGSSYKHKFILTRHKKYQCGVEAQFQCADCLGKFKLKSHLKKHIVNKICHNRRNKNGLG